MATYKQRTLYPRHAGRHSPELDSPIAPSSSSASSKQGSHVASSSAAVHGHSHAVGTLRPNPADEILDNTSDQEWTSIRHTVSARARARQQQYLVQEQQRTQEWHFVLGQHQRSSLHAPLQDAISSDEYEDIFNGADINNIDINNSTPLGLASPRGQEPRDASQQLRLKSYRERASSVGQSSTISYSDLPSESGLDGLYESEDFSMWSQDDDDAPSASTIPRAGRSVAPSSPYAASHSSTTSLNNMIQPSFAHHFGGVSCRIHNQMPLHDGSGYFASRGPSSLVESDHGSDHGGWESSSSSTSSAFKSGSTRSRLHRHQMQQQQAWIAGSRRSISSTESDSVINNIALLQSRQAQSPSHAVSAAGSFAAHGQTSPLRPPLPNSSATRSRRPRGPSRLQNSSIYENDMEDIEAMVFDIPSKQGWLQVLEQTLTAFRSREAALDADDSMLVNPVKALARHASHDDADLMGLSRTLAPENKSRQRSLSNASINAVRLPITASSSSSSDSLGQVTTRVKQQVSASSLEALQRLQRRHKTSSYQNLNRSSGRLSSDSGQVSGTAAHRVDSPHVDPMCVHFPPTVLDRYSGDDGYPRTGWQAGLQDGIGRLGEEARYSVAETLLGSNTSVSRTQPAENSDIQSSAPRRSCKV